MKTFLLFIFISILVFPMNAQTYGIKADYLLDGHSDKIFKDPVVLVSKNRIIEVSFSKDIPDSVTLINLEGYTILPGLIDAHTHLLVAGGGFTEYENDNYRYSTTYRSLRAVSHLKTALHNGFTSIRDVCTEGAGYADVDLAKSVRLGHIDGPRIFPSTKGIAITGNYMPPARIQNWELEMPSGAQYVSGKDECLKATREQIANGAQWIKVFVDWWHVTFNLDELTTIVNEAKKLEYYVEYAGFSPMDAIKSGTSLAAELLERNNDLGLIKKGYIADIIAVKGNPLEDITLLQKVDFVMKDGKIHKNEVK